MKRTLGLLLLFIALPLFADEGDGILDRFTDPEKGKTTFIPKGNWSVGILGGYRSFSASGEKDGDGYAILSLLNIGDGSLHLYNVSPSFSFFLADDLSLGVRLDYSGYRVDTDLKLDFRDLINLDFLGDEAEDYSDLLNFTISGRHMVRNAWGGSLALRKYLSFFGSKTFAVFGEARLYAEYGIVDSCPINKEGIYVENKTRTSKAFGTGLKFAGGLCVKLRDNSAFTFSIPLVGLVYQSTTQYKQKTGNTARMSSFSFSRELDFMAIQVGYVHYIQPKKR